MTKTPKLLARSHDKRHSLQTLPTTNTSSMTITRANMRRQSQPTVSSRDKALETDIQIATFELNELRHTLTDMQPLDESSNALFQQNLDLCTKLQNMISELQAKVSEQQLLAEIWEAQRKVKMVTQRVAESHAISLRQ